MTIQKSTEQGELEREIQEILVRSAGLAATDLDQTDGRTLEELGLDSLASMELQAVVQDRYGVHIPDDSLEMSIGQIAAFLRAQPGKAA